MEKTPNAKDTTEYEVYAEQMGGLILGPNVPVDTIEDRIWEMTQTD